MSATATAQPATPPDLDFADDYAPPGHAQLLSELRHQLAREFRDGQNHIERCRDDRQMESIKIQNRRRCTHLRGAIWTVLRMQALLAAVDELLNADAMPPSPERRNRGKAALERLRHLSNTTGAP